MSKDENRVTNAELPPDVHPAKIAKTAGGGKKKRVFWGIVLVLLGWAIYNGLRTYP